MAWYNENKHHRTILDDGSTVVDTTTIEEYSQTEFLPESATEFVVKGVRVGNTAAEAIINSSRDELDQPSWGMTI